jgi:mannosyltransferase OCH1-like enzyme
LAERFKAAQPNIECQPMIPRSITQYWDATDPPSSVAATMQSWRDRHPSWDYRRFDDATAQDFLRANHPIDVLRAYMRATSPAQKADVFRLAYLVVEGGFYVDADDRCLQSLDTIVPPHIELATYQEMHGTIGNNFLGARPGELVLAIALDQAVQAINRGDHDLLWLSTGPGLMTRIMARLLSIPAGCDQLLRRAVVLDRSELFRAIAVHCRLPYKRATGHWAQSVFQVAQNIKLSSAATAPLAAGTDIDDRQGVTIT